MRYTLIDKITYMNEDFKQSAMYQLELPDDDAELTDTLNHAFDLGEVWFRRYQGKGAIERIAFECYKDFMYSLLREAKERIRQHDRLESDT